ncbi:MAG: hypothetical protein LUH51_01685 [Firmicutes bacterium]|nr:hypothetical protein [Bacillota bacterium]
MKLKQYAHFQMNFGGFPCKATAFLMGFPILFRALAYFALNRYTVCGGVELFACLIFPVLLSAAYVALLVVVQLNAPGIYGILGALAYALPIAWSFYAASTWRIVLSFPTYILAAVLLLGAVGGYFPQRAIACPIPALCAVVHLLSLDWDAEWDFLLLELSVIFTLLSLAFVPLALRQAGHRPRAEETPTPEEPEMVDTNETGE